MTSGKSLSSQTPMQLATSTLVPASLRNRAVPGYRAVIRQYAQLSLELSWYASAHRQPRRRLAKFGRMHDEMTKLVGDAMSDGTPIAVLLGNTLNSVTSTQTSGLAAYRDRLPTTVVLLLYISAIIAALLIGREQGVEGTSDIAGTICFILLVSIAVYVTQDLNRPESGLIRVSQEPIERLLSPMAIK